MSIPLVSLGFPNAATEAGAGEALTQLAGASDLRDSMLRSQVFEGCSVELLLDPHGEPVSARWSLCSAALPVLVHSVVDSLGLGFTSQDGKPLSPFCFRTDGETAAGPAMLELSGVGLETLGDWEGSDPSSEPMGDVTLFNGFVTDSMEHENRFTAERVRTATIWFPGALVRSLTTEALKPGTRVRGSMRIFGFPALGSL
jgi:hypothetical protein